MNKQEAFKIVLEELRACPLFMGYYDSAHGNKNFMYGVSTVMEVIADRADPNGELLREFANDFLKNLLDSEDKVWYHKGTKTKGRNIE